jgi:AICAR transformylase/IMP cyclohydrolase PurH
MKQVQNASILAIETKPPFVIELERQLKDRNITVRDEHLHNSGFDLANIKVDDSELIVFDIPNAFVSRFAEPKTISRFVRNNTFVRGKIFVGDEESAKLLVQNLHDNKIEEDAWARINDYVVALANARRDLEDVTLKWADSQPANDVLVFPSAFRILGTLKQQLRYGENPHQEGAFYVLPGRQNYGVATARQIQGRELSYNNINDTDAAFQCVTEFDPVRTAAIAIFKHANPCGVAEGTSLLDAYGKALTCDPVSAFGGVVAANQIIENNVAREMVKIFTEVIIAPGITPEAQATITKKKNIRLLLTDGIPDSKTRGFAFKSVMGGFLLQTEDAQSLDEDNLEVKTKRHPTADEWRDLKFAFRVVKHVKSNAIVYAKNCATVAIGAGQMSRIDSALIAELKARNLASSAKLEASRIQGSVAASDAFFPFADGLLATIEAGATAVIQPGGSIRDDEVIAAANDRNIAMVFTGVRHFRH